MIAESMALAELALSPLHQNRNGDGTLFTTCRPNYCRYVPQPSPESMPRGRWLTCGRSWLPSGVVWRIRHNLRCLQYDLIVYYGDRFDGSGITLFDNGIAEQCHCRQENLGRVALDGCVKYLCSSQALDMPMLGVLKVTLPATERKRDTC